MDEVFHLCLPGVLLGLRLSIVEGVAALNHILHIVVGGLVGDGTVGVVILVVVQVHHTGQEHTGQRAAIAGGETEGHVVAVVVASGGVVVETHEGVAVILLDDAFVGASVG